MTTTSTQTIELSPITTLQSSIAPINPGYSLQHRHPPGRDVADASLEHGFDRPTDPLLLYNSKKTEEDLKQMKNRGTSKKVQKFYREQNDLIDNMLSPLNPIDEESEQRQMLKVQSDNKRC